MFRLFCCKHISFYRKAISAVVVICFSLFTVVGPAGSQTTPISNFGLTASFQPPILRGMTVHPENPLLFDFIVDRGQDKIGNDLLKDESTKLIKYFLTSMTIPDKDAWVNLSPYEKDRIIPDALGQTEMGKVMLEQDYVLKQLAASLTNPDTELGKKYWDEVNSVIASPEGARQSQNGIASSPTAPRNDVTNPQPQDTNNFNKVWIVPDGATVVEKDGFAYITESKLNVMLDEDTQKNISPPSVGGVRGGGDSDSAISPRPSPPHGGGGNKKVQVISTAVFRQLILPKLIEEVNTGKNFATTRQVYQSVILAAWYKRALKDSLLGKIYADKSKIAGVETDDKDIKQKVYEQYLEAFKKGAYNVIKEEDGPDGETIPRKYFSGGEVMSLASSSLTVVEDPGHQRASVAIRQLPGDQIALVVANGVENSSEAQAIVASSATQESPSVDTAAIFKLNTPRQISIGALYKGNTKDTELIFVESGTDLIPTAYKIQFDNGVVTLTRGTYWGKTFVSLQEDIQFADLKGKNEATLTFARSAGTAFPNNITLEVKINTRNPYEYNYVLSLTSPPANALETRGLTTSPRQQYELTLDTKQGLILRFTDQAIVNKVQELINRLNEALNNSDFTAVYTIISDDLRPLFKNQEQNLEIINSFLKKIEEAENNYKKQQEAQASGAFQLGIQLAGEFSEEIGMIFNNIKTAIEQQNYLEAMQNLNILATKFDSNPNLKKVVVDEISRLFQWIKTNKIKTLDDLLFYKEIFDRLPLTMAANFLPLQWRIFAVVRELRDQGINISISRIAKSMNISIEDIDLAIKALAFTFVLSQLSNIQNELKELIEDSAVVKEREDEAIKDFKRNKEEIFEQIRGKSFGTYKEFVEYVKGNYLNGLPSKEILQVLSQEKLSEKRFNNLVSNPGEDRSTARTTPFIVNGVSVFLAGKSGYFAPLATRLPMMTAVRESLLEYVRDENRNNAHKYSQSLPGNIHRLDFRHENMHLYVKYLEDQNVILILGWINTDKTKSGGYDMKPAMKRDLGLYANVQYQDGAFYVSGNQVRVRRLAENAMFIPVPSQTTRASSAAAQQKSASAGVMETQGPASRPVGGIDFDPSKLNLQIKRDGHGVPLPLPQQDLENIDIKGLYPVIINILPVNAQTLPILGQLNDSPTSAIASKV